MVESSHKPTKIKDFKEHCTLQERISAIGDLKSVCKGFKAICKNTETLFGPKLTYSKSDWLVCHEEKGQTFH